MIQECVLIRQQTADVQMGLLSSAPPPSALALSSRPARAANRTSRSTSRTSVSRLSSPLLPPQLLIMYFRAQLRHCDPPLVHARSQPGQHDRSGRADPRPRHHRPGHNLPKLRLPPAILDQHGLLRVQLRIVVVRSGGLQAQLHKLFFEGEEAIDGLATNEGMGWLPRDQRREVIG